MERSITHGKPTDKNCQNAQNAQNARNALCAHGLGGPKWSLTGVRGRLHAGWNVIKCVM